ncbi:MAG: hypothetical protein WC641_04180 [Patescibacteria group bacterium]
MIGGCVPRWWHHHGGKLRINEANESKLVLSSSTAEVTIERSKGADYLKRFYVYWRIVHNSVSAEVDAGCRVFKRKQLISAFGITEENGDAAHSPVAEREAPGFFVSLGDYLNIPGPGTGHDLDPNVSILIDDEMRQAVRKLLGL